MIAVPPGGRTWHAAPIVVLPWQTWWLRAYVEDAVEVKLGSQGRLVLPKALRDQLGAEEGTVYEAHVEDGRLILETRQSLLRRMQRELAEAVGGGRSLAEELIAERRDEARREAGA